MAVLPLDPPLDPPFDPPFDPPPNGTTPPFPDESPPPNGTGLRRPDESPPTNSGGRPFPQPDVFPRRGPNIQSASPLTVKIPRAEAAAKAAVMRTPSF